jgi:DNA-binding response OmpR family regulator
MKTAERILVIEDEKPMRTALADSLASEGYRVLVAENGELGLEKALKEKPDLLLLDVMMPRLDGFALCSELRRLNIHTPILFLTAKGMVQDRVAGLNAGADDYLVKPFSTDELLARVRALLRRARRGTEIPPGITLGSLKINFLTQTALRGSKSVHFTAKEFAMLRLLFENAGQPISRERFLDAVWGYTAFPTTRTVDNHIAMLRAKLEPDPDQPQFIQTVHGVGYKLNIPKKSETT